MIKEITINEIDKIKYISNEIFNLDIKPNIYSKIFVYEKNDKTMGFIIYDLIYERCELEYIGVLKEYRKNNIASELMEYMINDTFNNNIDNISLEVDIYNIGAIKLYEKYNFQKKAIRKNYYNNHDAYLMVRVV